ncbi:MAG: methionine synthase [Cyanobacteria bacterium HKST-UBA06]|nr:methionine synthase [Cyanobacteria bacterium HKST-UBA06]
MREALKQRIVVFDGAMGTNVQTFNPVAEDFDGKDGCNDYLSITRPDIIQTIHERFIAAGCDVLETNSFGSNRIKLEEYGLADQIETINTTHVRVAQAAIAAANDGSKPRYIVGSLGPTGYLPSSSDPTLSNMDVDTLQETYYEQSRLLIAAGVDGLLIETGQDILEMKHAVVGAKRAIAEQSRDILLMAQPTLDLSGRMLLGTDVQAIVALFTDLQVDVLGFNCSTGPDEMRESIRYLSAHAPMALSVVPNAGLPENVDGCAHYNLAPGPFRERLLEFVNDFGVNIIGGCCGTNPEHIRALAQAVAGIRPKVRDVRQRFMVTSAIDSVDLDMDNRPIVIGERLNAQGSRKFKQILLDDDYDTMVAMGQEQIDRGAYLLDVCVAVNERDDEKAQMCELVRRLSYSVSAPLVIDSTEYDVIESALKIVPGRPVINSIHLEGDGERVHKVLPHLKKYGGAAVAMLIDAQGMAKTADRKKEVAQKLHDVVVGQYGMRPDTLIYDALTFTLATGEEEFRNSAVETFEAIRWIKENLPGTYTVLGVSNASFGLKPQARKVLNSVYLYHAVQAGLDTAIINARDVIPYPALNEQERQLADALVLNQHEQALAEFIEYFETHQVSALSQDDEADVERSVEEQIHWQVLNRKKEGIEAVLDEALKNYTPVEILNRILLPAMKEVGDKMATGELILPFVLQSAEVMKKSVAHLEQFLDKDDATSKGKLVLATVYGDVHDIGKNLVKTIFSNNGYEVYDLGKQVPLNTILEKAKEVGADAIGLSALLVTTSKQMAYCVDECYKQDLKYPIIVGGAAINRDYVLRISCLDGEVVYPAGVFYTKDAFEGLNVMNRLQDPDERDKLMAEYREQIAQRSQKQEQYAAIRAEQEAKAVASVVEPATTIPTPPFWGMRLLEGDDIPIDTVFSLMDFQSLYRLSWGLKNKSKDEFEQLVRNEFEPLQNDLMAYCKQEGIWQPQVLYGYVPCYREGHQLVVMSPDLKTERGRFTFPRQTDRDKLCLSDYFAGKPEDGQSYDVLPLQLVTMGHRVSEVCEALDKQDEYSRSYYLHGLATQMAEGLAEWNHRQIRAELAMTPEQGKRYSFGYPACPDLSAQVLQFALMDVAQHTTIQLTDHHQIVPEQSTSAFIVHHPKAKYYSV